MSARADAVLVDAGPLVALLVARDRHHAWAVARAGELPPPLLTCEAVLSEAQFLIQKFGGDPRKLLEMVQLEVLRVDFRVQPEVRRLSDLQRSYRDVPMSLADACLVRMSELHPRSRIMTTDGDFHLYRRNRRQVIPLIVPEAD